MKRRYLLVLLLLSLPFMVLAQRWPVAKAEKWYRVQGWLLGANYCPAYASNQLEFWQADTFNLKAIDRELGWAENLGMNCMRVYLHHVAWQKDKAGFKMRMKDFLAVAKLHGVKIMFVFFDDCWNDTYAIGKQPLPVPGIHNSGWLKDPGNRVQKGGSLLDTLQAYVKDVLGTFKKDKRILLWDLYNEPGQFDQHDKSLPLLKQVFEWARQMNPAQPLSSGVHDDAEKAITAFQLEQSDVITYHSYDALLVHQRRIDSLFKVTNGRPIICTEYMARKRGSTFASILPVLKKQHIGAISWGLVDGKTQTKYAWDEKHWGSKEPELWFHDIFRADGTPYDAKETELIKRLATGKPK